MKLEKIFKADNGNRYKIAMDLYTSTWENKFNLSVQYYVCEKCKRIFKPMVTLSDGTYSIPNQIILSKDELRSIIKQEWIDITQKELLKELNKQIKI